MAVSSDDIHSGDVLVVKKSWHRNARRFSVESFDVNPSGRSIVVFGNELRANGMIRNRNARELQHAFYVILEDIVQIDRAN
jgi:hypothetical protein